MLFLGLVITLAACSSKEEPPADMPMMASSAALERQLDIVAWADHVERGESDEAYDWVTQFEADTGCRVNVKVVEPKDDLLALLSAGRPAPSPPGDASWPPAGNAPYDLVIASGDESLQLIHGGWVQPIGLDRVPSFAGVDPRLQQASWHYVDGQHWGVPWQWRPNVLLYNTEAYQTAPTSWSAVFAEQKLADGKSSRGRIQAMAAPIYIADAALYLAARKPALGIKDPFELDELQYTEALAVLRAQRPLVARYWRDRHVQVQDFISEGVVASVSWPYQSETLLANKQPVATTVPAEGITARGDATFMVSGAPHPNCAFKWLDWSVSPRVQGDAAAWLGTVPTVPRACEGSPLLGADGCVKNGMELLERAHFWRTPEAKCAQHAKGCVAYDRWVKDFTTLVAGS